VSARKPTAGAVAELPDESMRERVVRVATDLFATNGYHGTGVQEIATAAGLGRGALYWHIKSKEDLLYEISMTLLEPITARAREIASSDAPTTDQIRTLARELLRNLATDRAGWTVSLFESRALSAERRAEVFGARRAYEAIWNEVLERGHAEGTLRPLTPVLRRGILGLFNSTYLWIEAEGEVSPEDIADQYVDVILEGLRAP
jgi:AcrR family transcriptional regulator